MFSYQCRGCGACCKGHGIGLDAAAGEVERLAAAYPSVVTFLRRRGAATTAFNPRDRCWFLADDGLCRVEVDHGRAAKPASCRLFPFNRVFRIGSWTVVDYNSVICPLQVSRGPASTHAEVLAEIGGITDAAVVGTALPAGDAEAEGRALVEREGAIAAACFAAAAAGELGGAAAAQGLDVDAAKVAIDAAFQIVAEAPWRLPDGETLAAALWLTPSLRFNELYGPRQYVPRAALLGVLPRMWLAWLGFAALGAELARRPLGLQELTTIWSEQAPMAYAMARWTDAAAIEPGPIELPGDDPGGVVRRLAQACIDNRKARRPLGDLAAPLLAARPLIERAPILKLADPVLRAAFQEHKKRR